jgi:hypothetical protein
MSICPTCGKDQYSFREVPIRKGNGRKAYVQICETCYEQACNEFWYSHKKEKKN